MVLFYTPPHGSGRVIWFHIGCLCIHMSICRTSVHSCFCFRTITWVNVGGFSPNLVWTLVLWRSGLGLLMGKFRQFLTEFFTSNISVFLFPDHNLSKSRWIFTKFGMCIDIVEIWFEIANGQTFINFWQLSACDTIMVRHYCFTFVFVKKYWFFSYFCRKTYVVCTP